ncbi:23S rRNA (pseudouridine(1915)-N(3))-methyltransferase RlmH [Spirochaetota bacterium]
MKKINIIAIGSIKENSLNVLIDDYIQRIKRYISIEIIEISDKKYNEENEKKYFQKIYEDIKNKLSPKSYIIVLDREGKTFDSPSFANLIRETIEQYQEITFIIGGSIGLPDEVKKRAHAILSFSGLTFPHQLFQLMLLEQIYRGFTILHNEKYHK